MRVRRLGDGRQIARIAEKVGRLDDHAARLVVDRRGDVFARLQVRRQADDFVARHMRQRRADVGILRMQPAGNHRAVASRQAMGHQHRLAARGRAVVHRGVRDLHSGQRGHLGLELEQDLQRALRDFRLIGRVAGQEFGTLDEMIDGRRNVPPIGARAEKKRNRSGGDAAIGDRRHRALDRHLALRERHVEKTLNPLVGRNVGEQRFDVRDADAGQHRLAFARVERQVAHGFRPKS